MRSLLLPALSALLMGASSMNPARVPSSKPRASALRPSRHWNSKPPFDAKSFPVAVWLQSPENAERYKQAGINLFVGLWKGPTEAQLAALKAAGMPVICDQNAVGLAHRADPIIAGWMHGDEPDNAQPVTDPATGKETYGPPVPPSRIVADYGRMLSNDPTRPVLLNLGQGVANDEWIGRGSDAKLSDYETYVKGSDIVSFDVYPVAGLDRPDSGEYLWYVAKGVDRLVGWAEGKKRVWNCIECTHIGNERAKATPHQVRAEVWMSLIHGSTGLIWFVHEFQPKFNEHALLDDPVMLPAVTTINRQIRDLAPVLNSPTIRGGGVVRSSEAKVPIDLMVKRRGGSLYLFAVGMRNAPARGTFSVPGFHGTAVAEVIGENRSLTIKGGEFADDFKPYDVHLYRIGKTH